MSNVLSTTKQRQVIALARLGWSLRRIEAETGVRRETDVPSNWVWLGQAIESDLPGSWWIQRVPDGEIQALDLELGDDFFRISPRLPPVEGETYWVSSFERDELPVGITSLEGVGSRHGRFTIGPADSDEPESPRIIRFDTQSLYQPFPVDTCEFTFDDTFMRFFVEPDSQVNVFTLRRTDLDRTVSWGSIPFEGEIFLGEITPDPFLLPYEITAFDLAGNSKSIQVEEDAGCPGACSSTGNSIPLWLLSIGLFIRNRRSGHPRSAVPK